VAGCPHTSRSVAWSALRAHNRVLEPELKPETWVRIRQVFERAVALAENDQSRFLEKACGGEPEVRQEVERLLSEDGAASDFLEPLVPGVLDFAGDPRVLAEGSRLGPYEIRRVLASGGMGTVYEALQDKPRRSVALKTLRHGFGSVSRRRRFEFEAEVLGTLRHPGIAQIYASDTHDDAGRDFPYFAMEYVEGARDLLQYAGEQRLSLRERIELFIEVCDAVHHGHVKGVVHRDLKPGNILVDREGRPKVIDFGVARATAPALRAAAAETREGQLVGTLHYMSPEQLTSREVDTRSDGYSLGCILHELLTGTPPHDFGDLPIAAIARALEEAEPRRPENLSPDLGWIVLKCLQVDLERRYPSVSDLATDLRRYLRNEPVLAGPPSATYRFRKFVRRQRLAIATGLAVLTALSVGLARAELARRETVAALTLAEDEAARARATLEFFERAVESVDPQESGPDVLLSDVLLTMAERAEEELTDRPRLELSIRAAVGRSLGTIGRTQEAVPQLERALALHATLPDSDALELARARHDLGTLLQVAGRLDEAEPLLLAALEGWRAASEEDVGKHLATINRLGTLWQQMGRYDEGAVMLERGVALAAHTRADDDREALMTRANLAMIRRDQGRLDEGLVIIREVVETCRRARGSEHPDTVLWELHLASLLLSAGELEEGEDALLGSLDVALAQFGVDHPYALQIHTLLGSLYDAQGRFADAAAFLSDMLPLMESSLGEAHPSTLLTTHNLGICLFKAQDMDRAELVLQLSLERHRNADRLATPRTVDNLSKLQTILTQAGRWDEVDAVIGKVRADLAGEDEDLVRRIDELREAVRVSRPPAIGD
jgi:tetratricopeptide (TPR) repeat protein